GYRRIADDPLAGLVDVFPGGQIHHGVGTPADAPGQLGDLFLNGGAEGRVADVAIDLDQKVAADNHRLEFWVVDIGGENGATGRDLGTDEFRCDLGRNPRAKGLAGVLSAQGPQLPRLLYPHVLPNGHILHFRGDDAAAGVVQLADVVAGRGAPWLVGELEAQLFQTRVCQAGTGIWGAVGGEDFGVIALG